tara:strand:+ start:103 stop:1533 length:1431 start_codon:yes stop_codon:yes gene_type:complete
METLNKSLMVFLLMFSCLSQAQWNQVGEDIDGETSGDTSGYSVSLNSIGDVVAIGSPQNENNGYDSGQVRIFQQINNDWIIIGDEINGEFENDLFGNSVSLNSDGSIIAIGARTNSSNGNNSGLVKIYQNTNSVWEQIGSSILGEVAQATSGWSVNLSSDGSIVVIGSPNYNIGKGQIRVFENIGGNWFQLGQSIEGLEGTFQFGEEVSINNDGNIIAVKANDYVHILKYINGNWESFGQVIEDIGPVYSVNLSSNGQVVSIGIFGEYGKVRVYNFENDNWELLGQVINGDELNDDFGCSVSLNDEGTIVAIGAKDNNGNGINSGIVKIYKIINETWIQIGDNIVGENEGNDFGWSVNLNSNGSRLAIGGPTNGENGFYSGHTRVFENELLNNNSVSINEILLYPNPTNGILNYKTLNNENFQLTIFDVTGKIMLKKILNSVNNISQIDISNVKNGMYFVKIETTKGSFAKKIIKE